jgi:DNA-binding NtrC family response regulator
VRILVVDDEAPLLALIERYLRRLGCEVEAHANPAEALRSFEAAGGRFDIVMVDLELPGIPGAVLVEKLLGMSPTIRALVCSGYPFQSARFDAGLQTRIGFLQKPFLPNMLSEALEALMAGSGAVNEPAVPRGAP